MDISECLSLESEEGGHCDPCSEPFRKRPSVYVTFGSVAHGYLKVHLMATDKDCDDAPLSGSHPGSVRTSRPADAKEQKKERGRECAFRIGRLTIGARQRQ